MKKVILVFIIGCMIVSLQGCLSLPNQSKYSYMKNNTTFLVEKVEFNNLNQKQIYANSKNWHNNVLDYSSSRKIIQQDEKNGLLVIKGQAGLKYDNCFTCITRNMIKATDESFSYILELHIKNQEAQLIFSHIEPNKKGNNELYKNKNIAIKNRLKDVVKEYEYHILNPEAQPQASEPM